MLYIISKASLYHFLFWNLYFLKNYYFPFLWLLYPYILLYFFSNKNFIASNYHITFRNPASLAIFKYIRRISTIQNIFFWCFCLINSVYWIISIFLYANIEITATNITPKITTIFFFIINLYSGPNTNSINPVNKL